MRLLQFRLPRLATGRQCSGVSYYVSSSASFSGTVTFQPNCVIKLASNGYLLLYGPIVCNGTLASPSILTSKDDNLYGDTILSSTGNPVYAANPAMWIYYVSFSTTIQGVKIRWATKAVRYDANSFLSHTFRDSRIERCDTGIYANNCAEGKGRERVGPKH